MKNKNFTSIITGLKQAIDYERGKKVEGLKRHKVSIAPLAVYDSNKIKSLRNKLNYSQSIFASILGVSKKTIEAWETGRNTPNGSAKRLLELLENKKDLFKEYKIINTP